MGMFDNRFLDTAFTVVVLLILGGFGLMISAVGVAMWVQITTGTVLL